MDGKTLLQRPMGPRTLKRNPLPTLQTNPQPDPPNRRPALTIKPISTASAPPQPPPPAQPEPARPPPPSLSLSVPRVGNGRQSAPKMSLKINATPSSGPLFEIYAGGPTGPPTEPDSSGAYPDEKTIRPPSTIMTTQKPTDTYEDLRVLVETGLEELKISAPTTVASDKVEFPGSLATGRKWADSDFEELERLGEGAGGAVAKVRDRKSGLVLARKVITTREAPMKQLQRELTIAATVEHINIIKWYGAYMSPSMSEIKIIIEFCEGGSLESVGKRLRERGGVVGEKIAGRLAEGILQGLAYLHTKKTIHRDIKPPNILLSREGIVKLCDFGVSGELINSIAGTFTGTSFYMAPERICGHEYTIRSDVWSTGISLLELVQNRFPFPNDLGAIELMMYITTGEPPRLEDEPESGIRWSDDMKDFIKQTLIVDAATRPTPKEMLSHPWIINVMKQEVHMSRWIRQVWGWPKPTRRSRDESSLSRPSTSGGVSDVDQASAT